MCCAHFAGRKPTLYDTESMGADLAMAMNHISARSSKRRLTPAEKPADMVNHWCVYDWVGYEGEFRCKFTVTGGAAAHNKVLRHCQNVHPDQTPLCDCMVEGKRIVQELEMYDSGIMADNMHEHKYDHDDNAPISSSVPSCDAAEDASVSSRLPPMQPPAADIDTGSHGVAGRDELFSS